MKLLDKFHGIRTYETDDEQYMLDVDDWGNVKKIYKRVDIETYGEINLSDAPAVLRNARFERD